MGTDRDRNSIKEAKKLCREEANRKLRETDAEYRRSAADAICDAVLGLDEFRQAETILAYSSVGREVSTIRLIEEILGSGRKLCLPRCTDIGEDGKRIAGAPEMEARYVSEYSVLAEGAYGIFEPEATDEFPIADPADIDLVILPCVSCDAACSRLGHGAGYYDKYLSSLGPECRTAALCYEALIADEVPVEEHDMPVDAVVTEKQVYRWRR